METMARSQSERGELILRRRDDGALELRVNGVFVMDTLETTSERLLARMTLDLVTRKDSLRVLIGGLGLGFTLDEVLTDSRVGEVVVAEIEPDLVSWHRAGLIPALFDRPVLDDARVVVQIGDVRACVAEHEGESFDLVLLDVDNGPGFLVYDENATVYDRAFLVECKHLLRAGGSLAIWSAEPASPLSKALAAVFGEVLEQQIPVTLGTRETSYYLLAGLKD